jgi:hypothetical protein
VDTRETNGCMRRMRKAGHAWAATIQSKVLIQPIDLQSAA